jgi:hypothetical protein
MTKRSFRNNSSRAAKTLRSTTATTKQKSVAGKTLARHSAAMRTIKPAPRTGVISRSKIKRAVRSVFASRKRR